MTDARFYLLIGLPVFAISMNILAGMLQMNSINARLTSFESTMNARFTSLENRFIAMEYRFAGTAL